MPGLCSSAVGEAGGFRGGSVDEHLCIDGSDIPSDGRLGLDYAQIRLSQLRRGTDARDVYSHC